MVSLSGKVIYVNYNRHQRADLTQMLFAEHLLFSVKKRSGSIEVSNVYEDLAISFLIARVFIFELVLRRFYWN